MMIDTIDNQTENLSLYNLMQNEVVGVIALHSFTLGFHNIAKNKGQKNIFPQIKYLFYVLPVVYNMASLTAFLNSQAVYTALRKDPSIQLGLQDRAQKMMKQTFDALNIAFSKKILAYDHGELTINLLKPYSSKKLMITIDAYHSYNSVKQIQDCAYKLGGIFAKVNEKNIQFDLNITF